MALTSNTHHAYLNTDIVISNDDVEPIKLVDDITKDEFLIKEQTSIKLCAGKHNLRDLKSGDCISITVEDAIKIGGSVFKKEACFISEDTPWVFITMKDRLYIYNQDNKYGRVEYCLAPDEVIFTRNTEGNIFILRTSTDYTLFNVAKNKVLLIFQDIAYYNDHIVVYNENKKLIVYDFVKDLFLYKIDTEYTICVAHDEVPDMLFFISTKGVTSFNLFNNIEDSLNLIPFDNHNGHASLLGYIKNHLYSLTDKWIIFPDIIVDLIKKKIYGTTLPDSAFVRKILKKELCSIEEFYNECLQFNNTTSSISKDHPHLRFIAKSIEMERLLEDDEDLHLRYVLRGYQLTDSKYVSRRTIEYHDKNLSNGKDILMEYHDFYSSGEINNLKDNHEALVCSEGTLITSTHDGKLSIVERDGKLYVIQHPLKEFQILNEIYDATFCTNAFFTSDGKHVILEKSIGVRDFFELDTYESSSFPIEGVPTDRFLGYNGYKPLADHTMPWGAAPVWIDPLTMRRITPSVLNARSYTSPNGLIQVDTNFKSIFYNNLTQAEISKYENYEYAKYYCWCDMFDASEKEAIVNLRKELVAKHKEIFYAQTAKYNHSSKGVKETLNHLIETCPEFTQIFIDNLGYVSYKDNGVEKRVLIDRSVRFLNYVSFSKDSRYMAFGAKLGRNLFRSSEDGLFVVYDLVEEKEVVRISQPYQESTGLEYSIVRGKEVVKQKPCGNIWAVWTTQFSSRNDVACYDGQPTTYIKMNESKRVLVLNNRSFLCFSPSGKYVALSEQGYISYTHNPDADWGHQPSTNVYIHPVDSSTAFKYLGPYSDLGEDICGTRHNNIASAAFSVDEKRLLMVGEDGVIVVRNLHLDQLEETTRIKRDSEEHRYSFEPQESSFEDDNHTLIVGGDDDYDDRYD